MQPSKRQSLRQVELAFFSVDAPSRYLHHRGSAISVAGQQFQHFRAGLGAAAGNQMLVLCRAGAISEMQVAQSASHQPGEFEGVGARGGRVREVEGEPSVPGRAPDSNAAGSY